MMPRYASLSDSFRHDRGSFSCLANSQLASRIRREIFSESCYIQHKLDHNYPSPIDLAPNQIPFGGENNRKMYSQSKFGLFQENWEKIPCVNCAPPTEKTRIQFPFKLNGTWSWWQFSFRYWTKWNSIWFKIERKNVTTIISHWIWEEIKF